MLASVAQCPIMFAKLADLILCKQSIGFAKLQTQCVQDVLPTAVALDIVLVLPVGNVGTNVRGGAPKHALQFEDQPAI